MKLLYKRFPFSGKFIPFILLFPFLILHSFSLAGQCCTSNPIVDNSFEISISVSEKFPDAITTTTTNALTYDPANWTYADGDYSLDPTIINDATRASSGNQFAYIPNPGGTPTFNKCLGNGLSYTSSYSCQSDYYTTGVRYIASFNYIPFNKDVPTGGTGSTTPKFEYSFGALTEINLYDNSGSVLSGSETAVAWNNVSGSWKTAYGLVPASTSNGGLVLWFSHDRFGTCGMLIDNTDLEMIELTAHGLSGVTKGGNTSEISFSLNPSSNVVGLPNISYQVIAPSGYTVNPTTGTYNTTTNFTLTVNSRDMISDGVANIDLTVRDEVNTGCSVIATIENPYSPDNDEVASIIDLDDDNDGISDTQELCGTDPIALQLTTPIDVTINFDDYPGDITWSLDGPSGQVDSGGPFSNGYANSAHSFSINANENGAHTLTLYDSYGDGLNGNNYSVNGVDFSIITTTFTTGSSSNTGSFTISSIVAHPYSCLSADPMDDSDGDLTLNYKDADYCTLNSSGVCASMDADNDGIINSLDRDSDNDGIPDVIESGSNDTDGDGMVDETTDVDNDGLMDVYDTADSGSGGGEVTNGTSPPNVDTDGDGLKNSVDLDADNDGIPDLVESNGIDSDGDGRVDVSVDTDNDGFADIYDPDDDGSYGIDSGESNAPLVETDGSGNLSNSGSGNSLNHDSDAYADYLDLDSDNDGIPDIVEVGATDGDNDGKVDTALLPWDADGDGLADVYDENAADGPAGSGTNGMALVETSADTNNDGLINSTESMTPGSTNTIDFDADNISNHLDIDADNDGITDVVENASGDTDADNGGSGNLNGRVYNFTDADNNGWNDSSTSATTDSDGDNLSDYTDIDTDNDGITDYVEGVCTSCPTSGGPTGADSDQDGLLDIYETLSSDNADNATGTNQGVSPNLDDDDLTDTDPDYLDTDADEDGSFDWNEGFDIDGDGSALDDLILMAANYETANGDPGDYNTTDTDTDGIPDWADNLSGEGYNATAPPPFLNPANAFWLDSNTDGLVALFDINENGTAAPTPDNNSVTDDDWRDNGTSVALPVELIQFKVKENQCHAVVEWTTELEINVNRFEIEYSQDGLNFETLKRIAPMGGLFLQDYSFEFVDLRDWGIYRLKIINNDYSFEYSDWRILDINCATIEVYPNPMSLLKGELTIDLRDYPLTSSVDIYNQLGIHIMTIDKDQAINQLIKLDMSAVPVGIYYLKAGKNILQKIAIIE